MCGAVGLIGAALRHGVHGSRGVAELARCRRHPGDDVGDAAFELGGQARKLFGAGLAGGAARFEQFVELVPGLHENLHGADDVADFIPARGRFEGNIASARGQAAHGIGTVL